MLLELGVKNFRSIKDWQSFSMLSEKKIKEHPESVIEHNGFNILSSAIIYGRNASGKSNLLRAFKALQALVIESSQFKVDNDIELYEPYKLDLDYINEPIEFKIDFIAKNKVRYVYEVGFTKSEIKYELLRFYPKSQPALLFNRKKGKQIKFGEYLIGRKKEIEDLLYKNQLFLSKVGTEKIDGLTSPYSFFTDFIFTSIIHDTDYDNSIINFFTHKMGKGEIPSFNLNINKLIKSADTGIQGISIKEIDINPDDFPEEMEAEIKNDIIDKFKYRIRTKHKQFKGEKEVGEVEFQLREESTGTIKLMVVGGLILDALETGQVLIIDELDKSLHPKLTRALIKIFHNPQKNPNKAQLIFATHDTSLLDNKLFRRDQVWFSEKEYEGYSHYYSISDIPGIRANIPFEKWYMSGRFGGSPVINDHELNFQFHNEY